MVETRHWHLSTDRYVWKPYSIKSKRVAEFWLTTSKAPEAMNMNQIDHIRTIKKGRLYELAPQLRNFCTSSIHMFIILNTNFKRSYAFLRSIKPNVRFKVQNHVVCLFAWHRINRTHEYYDYI